MLTCQADGAAMIRHAAAVAAMLVWCAILMNVLGGGGWQPDLFRPSLLGQVFNSMAEHLVHGRFDVDPDAIGFEAFDVDGRSIAYFGVFCALFRLPLLLHGGWIQLDITRLSCFVAIGIGAWFQLRAIWLVRGTIPDSPRRTWLTAALTVSVLLGGQQIQFLRPSVYQEVINWAGAQSMVFVYLAVRGLLTPRGFDPATLRGMACCAGLALLTRVSAGIGLYAALGLLVLVLAYEYRRGGEWRAWLVTVAILAVFALGAGIVNQGRWGDPLIFADFTRYAMNLDATPDRLGRLAAYGTFNIARIWLGLGYYFVPLWTIIGLDGHLLFTAAASPMIDAMELPPGSFFLSDPLLIALCAAGIAALRQPRSAAVAAGLAISPLLMLCAISMNYRYRMEFYPFLVFGALLGFRHVCRPGRSWTMTRRARVSVVLAVVVGVVVSHAQAALYAASPWGPAEAAIERDGWIGTYMKPDALGRFFPGALKPVLSPGRPERQRN